MFHRHLFTLEFIIVPGVITVHNLLLFSSFISSRSLLISCSSGLLASPPPLPLPSFLSYWQKRVCDGDDLGRKMPNRSRKTCQQPRVVFVRDTPFVAVGCTCCFIVNTNQNLSDPRLRDQLQKFSETSSSYEEKKMT